MREQRTVELWGGPLCGVRRTHQPEMGRFLIERVRSGWWVAYRVHEWLAHADGTRKAIVVSRESMEEEADG